MLVVTRKLGERIDIGDGVSVSVVWIGQSQVRLGIEAPANVRIWRGEVTERIKANKANEGSKSDGE